MLALLALPAKRPHDPRGPMTPPRVRVRARAPRQALGAAMSLAGLMLMTSEASAYKLNQRRIDPARFPLQIVFVGAPPPQLTLPQVEQAAAQAASTWSQVGCSLARLTYAGWRPTLEQVRPGQIPVRFVTPGQDPCFPEQLTLIGIAASLCSPPHEVVIVLNQRDYQWAMQPDLLQQLVPSRSTATRRVIDLPGALTHELGHVLGLAHPDDPPDPQDERLATMSRRYLLDGGQATLAADDRAGLCALYPAPGQERTCDDSPQCRLEIGDPGATCVRRDDPGVWVCEEERAEIGRYCAQNLLICPERCVISSPGSGTGYCTRACQDQEDCPQGWRCGPDPLAASATICLWGEDADLEDQGAAQLAMGLAWGLALAARRRRGAQA